MSKETLYRQCHLSRGTGRTSGYIEERGAIVGKQVELVDDNNNLWYVDSVGDKSVPQSYITMKRNADKHPSIEGH